MRVDPAIASLRRKSDLQRRAQAAMRSTADAWRQEPQVAKVLADLHRFAAGDRLALCPSLRAALTGFDAASGLIATLCRYFAYALRTNRFGQAPFRHGFDGRTSTLLLARCGRAHLVLQAIEPGRKRFSSAGYSDAERHEIVLAGSARARVVRYPGFGEEPLRLRPRTGFTLDLSCEALQVLEVKRRLVTLRLHRCAAAPAPSREYALNEGVLLHQSSGDIMASRREMAITLLGRMGHICAAPTIAALACEAGDPALRWQALRECLALDAAEGFRALSRVADTEGDPLAEPARALRDRLIRSHPVLQPARGDPCPA